MAIRGGKEGLDPQEEESMEEQAEEETTEKTAREATTQWWSGIP